MSIVEWTRRRGEPKAHALGVETFYDLLRTTETQRTCTGTACSYARGFPTTAPSAEIHCVGRCYQAPTHLEEGTFPVPWRVLGSQSIVFKELGSNPTTLPTLYATPAAETILQSLEQSGLRGRGGAAYPTGAKWRAAKAAQSDIKYVVANGDEGDPGSFVDRLLLEKAPHAVLAGMNACAKAIGATHGVVYIRGEYPFAAAVMANAIAEAVAHGLFVPGFHVEIHQGKGSYVCGEETALLRAIEGQRAEPTPKPPYPAESGLYSKPTVVQNIETLAVVPWVLATGQKPSTKAFSLSGAVQEAGAVEAALGISLQELLHQGAGGPKAGLTWKMALVGGPMGRVVPASAFASTILSYEAFPGLGHGGVVVMDERVSAKSLAHHLYAFAASESCGNCTPCRVGTAQLRHITTPEGLERLFNTLEWGSLCGFGQGVPRPLRDLLAHYRHELFPRQAGVS